MLGKYLVCLTFSVCVQLMNILGSFSSKRCFCCSSGLTLAAATSSSLRGASCRACRSSAGTAGAWPGEGGGAGDRGGGGSCRVCRGEGGGGRVSVGAEGEQVRGSPCGLRPRDGNGRLLGRAEQGGRGAEVGGRLSRSCVWTARGCSARMVLLWVASGNPLGSSAPLSVFKSTGGSTAASVQ